jgi:isocitrate dehydrogenase
MKQTDGLFHNVFKEIAKEYPEIITEHLIVDIGAARLANSPEDFDVIVMPNLYGDILSDVAAQITGSVGLAGSANIGEECAMFEAIHGSAPLIAGQNIANPSGLLQGAVMMLNHIGQSDIAQKIQNAWLKTIESGIHTADIYKEGVSKKKVSTSEFAIEVVNHLGEIPAILKPAVSSNAINIQIPKYKRKPSMKKELVGVDIFVHWNGEDPNELAEHILKIQFDHIKLKMITNRGIKVWPDGFKETFCTDHWRCRFETIDGVELKKSDIIKLLNKAEEEGIDTIKTENLYLFDGVRAYSLGQGQ